MTLLSPDFGSIWIWIMVFFGGCMAYQPPKPMEIQTPKSVTSVNYSDNSNLLISVNKNKVNFNYKDKNGGTKATQCHNDSAAIAEIIKQHIRLAEGKANLKIAVKSHVSNKENWEPLLGALKTNEILSFKFTTTPE